MNLNYYKLTDGRTIVGVVTSSDFRKYKPKTHMCVYSTIDSAQFAEYSGKYYRDDWLRPLEDCPVEMITIGIVHIEEAEYNDLKSQFDEGNFVEDGSLDAPVEKPTEPNEEEQEVVQLTTAQLLDRQIKLAARFAEV